MLYSTKSCRYLQCLSRECRAKLVTEQFYKWAREGLREQRRNILNKTVTFRTSLLATKETELLEENMVSILAKKYSLSWRGILRQGTFRFV